MFVCATKKSLSKPINEMRFSHVCIETHTRESFQGHARGTFSLGYNGLRDARLWIGHGERKGR